jgi:protein phosphatase-4 regulatory subunit 3
MTKKWRVKLYRLNENGQWDDNGIGFVFCASKIEKDDIKINKLIMTNEITYEEMFSIDINKDTVNFHNQRGTIMTWKTSDDKIDDDTAISFQEKEGVTEIMKNILICEGKNPNDERLLMEIQSEIYLEASIQNLPNLVRELNIDMGEEKLIDFITYLKNNDCKFIIELGELLNEEEKKIENLRTTTSSNKSNDNINIINEDEAKSNDYNQKQIYKDFPMENIHYIFTIFKNLVLIGDKELLELLIDDNLYLITFGALEYDFETMKSVPHRKYFKDIVKFKNPLNIDDQSILKKINQNLRLTYLRDTALSRLIDDNSVKTINLMIQLNNNDLIQFFLNDNKYFEILFKQMQNEDLNSKKESCLFLLELIECSKDVPQSRVTFNENLFDQGILSIISNLLDDNKKDDSNNKDIEDVKEFIKITSIEIFINILSIIPNTILEYLKKEDNHKLLKQLINIMIDSDNFGIKYEISQIYKTLIETEFKGQAMDRMELFSEPFQTLLKYLNKPIDLPISHEKKWLYH